ncbi:MAG: YdcF family protein [Nanoarchaeota archaeon]|nr:YdcF family protein [Nanoarchaeota archaeon]
MKTRKISLFLLFLFITPALSYDVIIVLGHETINNDTDISLEWRERILLALEFMNESEKLILSGGYSNLALKYVNVPVIIENDSLDTVGNAVYTKRIILENNWTNLLVVTNNYHVKRAYNDFKYVYGEGFKISFSGAPAQVNDLNLFFLTVQELFKTLFKKIILLGVPEGNHELILERLMKYHPWY